MHAVMIYNMQKITMRCGDMQFNRHQVVNLYNTKEFCLAKYFSRLYITITILVHM